MKFFQKVWLWVRRPRTQVQGLKTAFKTEAESALPCLVEHSVDNNFQFDHLFKVEHFRGLLYCQLISDVDPHKKRRLTSCWLSAEHFRTQEGEFLSAIGSATVEHTGFHREFKWKAVSWWRKLSPLAIVLACTTLLGAYGTLKSQFREWFAQPEVIIYPTDQVNTIDIPVGKMQNVRFAVKNTSDWAKATVQFTEVTVVAPDGSRANQIDAQAVRNRDFPALAIGETKELVIPLEGRRKGNYRLILGTKTKAGEFVRRKFQQHEFNLSVWPNHEFLLTRGITASQTKCSVRVLLASGVEENSGVQCEAVLTNAPGVVFQAALPAQRGWACKDQQSPGSEVAIITWNTPKLKAFERTPIVIYLEAPAAKTSPEWTNIIDRLAFSFR